MEGVPLLYSPPHVALSIFTNPRGICLMLRDRARDPGSQSASAWWAGQTLGDHGEAGGGYIGTHHYFFK